MYYGQKYCPIIFIKPSQTSSGKCLGVQCEFWCESSGMCSIPLLAKMLANGIVCRNVFKREE